MVSLQYKGRIHRAKFTARSLRYVLSDQAARLFPALQRRWLFPVEAQPIWDAAAADLALPTAIIDGEIPAALDLLGRGHPIPLQSIHHIYSLNDVVVTGWAGAMMKDGLLLTIRSAHNWASGLRAHPHKQRTLPDGRPYFNLMAPIPARGHIFHWLFDSLIPLLSFLESGAGGGEVGLIVNAELSEIQKRTIDYLKNRYGISRIETVGKHEALLVPWLQAFVPVPHNHRALQAPAGLARLNDLAAFLSAGMADEPLPRRIYVSRSDARLRRVLNEDEIAPLLKAFGVERVVLKGMPIGRQIQLFRKAEIVIAPHGGGLAHLSWCKPGTKIVEIFPDPRGPRGRVKNATCEYWHIAQMRGLTYTARLAGPILNRNDGFKIEPDVLRAALHDAGMSAA